MPAYPVFGGWCEVCDMKTSQTVARFRMQSGNEHMALYCLNGDHYSHAGSGRWLPKDRKEKFFEAYQCTPDDLLIFNTFDAEVGRCCVCGGKGVELHHWAPKQFFGDEADDWPTSLLCRTHHREWHDKVTPREKSGEAAS